MARRKRKRRSVELRNSLRLGALLAALVGVNVYVFFFNRHTAPREVLNLQSTSKTIESQKQEVAKKDAEGARGKLRLPTRSERAATTVASSSAAAPAPAPTSPAPAPARTAAALASTAASTAPAATSAGVPTPLIQIPFAPPEELPAADEAAAGPVEKTIGNNDTLG
ncbi:MAG TPA: hypothetical protein VMU50_22335, partial [Polyangia bacterium]|nr:hypothetical protein [Polyangia bacterium]